MLPSYSPEFNGPMQDDEDTIKVRNSQARAAYSKARLLGSGQSRILTGMFVRSS